MNTKKQASKAGENPVNRGRHEHQCRICSHPKRDEIEQAFILGQSGTDRQETFRQSGRSVSPRARIRADGAAASQYSGCAGTNHPESREVDVNAAAVVSAASAYARINSRGEWVERTETVNLNALFDRMSQAELEAYAKEGVLPSWFTETVGTTAPDSQDSRKWGISS